jgi:hypothetical protein
MMAGKGQGVQSWEAIADAAKGIALERRKAVREYVGDVPARSVRRTPDDKAQQFLPDFYARGMASGPVGLAYWTQLLQERGPKGMVQFGREMVKLMDSPKHWATPILASSPAQQRQTALLRQQGSHGSVVKGSPPDLRIGTGYPVKPPTGGTNGTTPR